MAKRDFDGWNQDQTLRFIHEALDGRCISSCQEIGECAKRSI